VKRLLVTGGKEVHFYSVNLCNYEDKGDYELFPTEELSLDIFAIGERLMTNGNGRISGEAAEFNLEGVDITVYKEGRLILEGVIPDTHEKAFELLERIIESG